MPYVSAELRSNIVRLQGEVAGNATADQMESVATQCFEDWQLDSDGAPFPSDYGLVLPVQTREGERAVFKVHQVFELENAVPLLRLWSGFGGARLLRATPDELGILIERADPGLSAGELWTLEDDERLTREAATMLRSLQSAPVNEGVLPKSNLQSAAGRGLAFHRYWQRHQKGGPLPDHLVQCGERVFRELGIGETILHGDFHHFNLLRHRDGWVSVDPQGVLGPPEMDAGPWMTNPWPVWVPHIGRNVLERRLKVFQEVLGWDPELVKAWALARAAICAVWSDEDNEGLALSIEIFERIWQAWDMK